MNNTGSRIFALTLIGLIMVGAGFAPSLEARIDGVSATTFNLTAREGHISTGDGNQVYMWGYANGDGPMQYPGVTMIVRQGDRVTVNLSNQLHLPVSIVFPGQKNVEASGGTEGLLTREAGPGETVSYTFIAARAGTFIYHSGTRPELQTEMGLTGAMIVRPYGYDASAPRAHPHSDSAYDYETLFLLTEIDSRIHDLVETQGESALAHTDYLSDYFPNYWFINGRNGPDTMLPAGYPMLPAQPYNCLPRMHPGDRLLLRVIGAGRDLHPFHPHGNHVRIIARDGNLLGSSSAAGSDLAEMVFTIQSHPGQTMDAIFEWTGKGLGWDIYGTGPDFAHDCNDNNSDGYDDVTSEYCADHGKPFPVALPEQQDLAFGGFYSGSPFLGTSDSLPPGEGGLNPNAGYVYMWHSHTEKEMVNYDIFPGGMMTMLIIEPHGILID